MQLQLNLEIPPIAEPISYKDKILLIGSCFTEHMADRFARHKFKTLSNPHGIIFNPLSVTNSLDAYVSGKQYTEDELFYLNELWNSWDHHTGFSDIDKQEALRKINQSQQEATAFIADANYIILTLGSAFQYYLNENGRGVANNHRAQAQGFEKRLLTTEVIIRSLTATLNGIRNINPGVKFIFTISPVRHIRDGVVDNNRSKARLIEAVHELCSCISHTYYFPAYELVIDILRDHRFYDIDLVHPNYLATNFVWEHFVASCIEKQAANIMKEVKEIIIARGHKPRFPETEAHRSFLLIHADKVRQLTRQYPFLDLSEELRYFQTGQ